MCYADNVAASLFYEGDQLIDRHGYNVSKQQVGYG